MPESFKQSEESKNLVWSEAEYMAAMRFMQDFKPDSVPFAAEASGIWTISIKF